MFPEQDRHRYRGYLVLLILLFIVVIISNTAQALEDLPELFFQNNWAESSEQIIVYLLNFYEISQESDLYFSFSAHFTGFDASGPGWYYSGEEDLLELVDLMGPGNSLTMEKYYSLLNREDTYLSWLLTVRDKPARLRIEEKRVDRRTLALEREKYLYISLLPREISFETGEVFTGIEFSFASGAGRKHGEGRVETALWLNKDKLENIAVVSRRLQADGKEEVRYYILQVAAALIPAVEYAELREDLKGDLLVIGDLTGLNKLLTEEDFYTRSLSRQLKLQWAGGGPGIEFRQDKEKFNYKAKLNLLSVREKELDYLFKFNYYLHDYEDLALSLHLANEMGINPAGQDIPVFRLGFSDRLAWTDSFSIALSYYPLEISKREDRTDLWQLNCLYKRGLWEIGYRGEFAGKDFLQELKLAYILDEDKDRAVIIGMDYGQEPGFLLAYRFNI